MVPLSPQASLIGARSRYPAMEGEEEQGQPPQEAGIEPVVAVGASEVVPRVLSGESQNLSDADALTLLLEMKLRRRRERPSLPRTVTELVAEDGSRVYVVGTAHFSDDSKKDVVKTIREVQPDVVVVELCQYRVSMLKMDEGTLLQEAKELSLEKLQQAVRQNGVMSGLMQMLLLKVSAHITEQLGMAPGGEFREAFKEASKVPFCKFHLGDRPIPVTFKRAIAALSFWQKVKLAWGLCFLSDPISKDDVERCKQKDLLEQMMAEMIGEFPDLHRTIVSERDIYLTYMLRQAARRLELPRSSDAEPRKCVPSVVVGVVGMGHVPGIEKNWTTDLNIQEIMTVPPPSISGRVSRLAVKAAFLGLLGYGLYWMGRRASSLVLSLPVTQYCLQRASTARPHKKHGCLPCAGSCRSPLPLCAPGQLHGAVSTAGAGGASGTPRSGWVGGQREGPARWAQAGQPPTCHPQVPTQQVSPPMRTWPGPCPEQPGGGGQARTRPHCILS
ncbi:traB domain-containing protein isoform X1 [Leptonychotes weddellii]|uniref:TraB domain-containing protein isoform X1 n=2 Tax=Leptonychotes weddellii TaxID=9713 RepID=A0A7F8QYG0_LEPWE|nr:traB domain-containing protein isoform X1 [Leptonychotes weddellii]